MLFINGRRNIWALLNLTLDELMQTSIGLVISLGIVPFDQDLISLCFGQHRQLRDVLIRIQPRSLQQCPPMADEAGDRRSIEEIGIVGSRAKDSVAAIVENHEQIHFRATVGDFLDRPVPSIRIRRITWLLGKHDLK